MRMSTTSLSHVRETLRFVADIYKTRKGHRQKIFRLNQSLRVSQTNTLTAVINAGEEKMFKLEDYDFIIATFTSLVNVTIFDNIGNVIKLNDIAYFVLPTKITSMLVFSEHLVTCDFVLATVDKEPYNATQPK